MIEHGDYFSATVAERLGAAGFEVVCWSGSEAEVAAGMQTCEYFVGCARGVWNGARRAHGFQLPTAEAMACGCVTVSYDTGGCLDYMCDGVNAFLARTDDEEGLLAAVRRARGQLQHPGDGHGEPANARTRRSSPTTPSARSARSWGRTRSALASSPCSTWAEGDRYWLGFARCHRTLATSRARTERNCLRSKAEL